MRHQPLIMVSHLKKNQSKINHKKIIMKNSVLILGIALVSFSGVCNANNTVSLTSNLFQNTILIDGIIEQKSNKIVQEDKASLNPSLVENLELLDSKKGNSSKIVNEISVEGDQIIDNTISDEEEFIEYEKAMKKIIAQSELIIDSTVSDLIFPLNDDKTINNEIAALEMIIESNAINEGIPLDFKKINKNAKRINSYKNESIAGMN